MRRSNTETFDDIVHRPIGSENFDTSGQPCPTWISREPMTYADTRKSLTLSLVGFTNSLSSSRSYSQVGHPQRQPSRIRRSHCTRNGNTAMASTQHVLLSPAELAYLHTCLSLTPPLRPDGRSPTQSRPLTAETGILPGANGSARVCFADGTEAIVGVKTEVEKTAAGAVAGEEDERQRPRVDNGWVEVTVEIPGLRDDDPGTAFLAAMLSEALLADGTVAARLRINSRFHWRLYVDVRFPWSPNTSSLLTSIQVILISPPLSYTLPLLSLTSHLALLSTCLPRLKSEGDEDPFFDDDWDAATRLFPPGSARPPVTLLVMAVGDNIVFDPSKEELAVADVALAISVGQAASGRGDGAGPRNLRLLSVRTIDPPSRLTAPGVPSGTTGPVDAAGAPKAPEARVTESEALPGLWKAPRGGAKVAILAAMTQQVLRPGGVADEVLDGLEGVELE
jgi:exosome complex component RRP42